MTITVLLFASFADAAGWTESVFDLSGEPTVQDVWDRVIAHTPALSRWPKPSLVARNREYTKLSTPLSNGDEVAFLPPIAGG